MRGLRNFAIIIGVIVAMVAVAALMEKRHYKWEPTFDTHDDEPFGCMLFDQLVSSALGQRYTADPRPVTLDAMAPDAATPQGWLILGDEIVLSPGECHQLLQMVRRGHRVMLCTHHTGYYLSDSIGVSPIHFRYRGIDMETLMRDESKLTHLVSCGDTRYPADSILEPEALHGSYLSFYSSAPAHKTLAHNGAESGRSTVAVEMSIGRGRLIMVSTPLMFTNYGMLSGRGSQYVFRLLDRFGQMSVRRVQLSTLTGDRQNDALAVLDYIERQPPLWWAWCITILLIILFMLTSLWRRQRPIPVVRAPQSHSHDFVRLIGTLYAQQEGHSDLVAKKWRYTAERLHREQHADLGHPADDPATAAIIARNTGLTPDEVLATLTDARRALSGRQRLNAHQMARLIDRLNALCYRTHESHRSHEPHRPHESYEPHKPH